MARPLSISDEDLLLAAREVFLQRGHGATTAEVAAHAGVSEGLLFKRYGTKEGLFHAAMGTAELLDELFAAIERGEPEGDAEAWLASIALRVLRLFRRVVPLALMSWSGRATPPPEMLGPNPPPVRVLRAFASQLERRMRDGRLAPHDPEIVARMLIGAMWHHVHMELVMPKEVAPLPEETFVRTAVHALFRGLAPHPGDPPRVPSSFPGAPTPARRRRS